MKQAIIVGAGRMDSLFDRSSPGNRDDCYLPYIELRTRLQAGGYILHTADVVTDVPAFEIHMNVHDRRSDRPAYLLLQETSLIHAKNSDKSLLAQYRKVFCWDDSLVDGKTFIKANFPNPVTIPQVDGFAARPHFCCVIAGNKSAARTDPRELYSERVKTIRWFEKHAPDDFALYGIGWDQPARRGGWRRKISKQWFKLLSRVVALKPFPSYRGMVDRKRDVLGSTRFCICYENVRDMPGYITEKIFDCFFSGCVPVYWGADNVGRYIPADCYIDRRKFRDTAELYAFLKTITEDDYRSYQQRIVNFLGSEQMKPFSSEVFAKTVAGTILADLGHNT